MVKQLGKTNTMFAVLGILSLGPHTGYDIKQHMEQSTRYFWNENYGQIYPSLSELLDRNDIAVEVIRQKGKPDKKLYSITDQGRRTLSEWLSQPMEHVVMLKKNELLLRVFFGSNSSPESIIKHIQEHKRELMENLRVFEELETWLRNAESKDHNFNYWIITINYGKSQFNSLISWCDDSINILSS